MKTITKHTSFELRKFFFEKIFWQNTVFKFRCAGYYKDAAVSPLMFFIFYVFSHERFSPFVASSLEVNARTLPADSHKEKNALRPVINYESQNIN